ncbi:hypothetical protein ACGFY9_14015 [Streptomyces sp. NPDC048504]|uniref:hypothetical protein n=1 Tax=Streptomyces sp. NPDC048504 TaxID=3365559 RepID=UPI0037248177
MTTSQLIASAITWIAAIAAVIGAALAWRAQQQARNFLVAIRAERRTFATPGGGEVTVTAPMSDAAYEELKARWLEAYGKPGAVAELLNEDGAVCAAYRLPATSESSGLCARCGMSDYKHQEPPT